ncbi:hypothetical protein MBAV_002521 [Candidatus Magnetobacterium bavaricum]|uniref:Uncharacterized protein n=1 Tax=Candidatus Magnetobacterium bavaricum TaxID=29290 RepID=A0A0F3GTN9_9BACT|nr:hypothetical protein MBAV_002521 [Candidatus Magnetobacterium bavaricum]
MLRFTECTTRLGSLRPQKLRGPGCSIHTSRTCNNALSAVGKGTSSPRRGRASSNCRVYSALGAKRISSMRPCSTALPERITTTLWA